MSVGKSLSEAAGRTVGSEVMKEVLATPEGHAAVLATAATVVAAAPVVLTLAGVGIGAYGVIKAADYLDAKIAEARKGKA